MHSSASDGVFHAIADPNRRRLIDLLADGEKSVQELAQGFDITVAAISQHLAVLLDSHLVSRRAWAGNVCIGSMRRRSASSMNGPRSIAASGRAG